MNLIHARHVAWRKIAEEFIVLDLSKRVMMGLNDSGGELWQQFSQARHVDMDLLKHSPSRAFVMEMKDRGLLVETETLGDLCIWPKSDESAAVSWQEAMQQVAGTCAFVPAQTPLCNQNPFS